MRSHHEGEVQGEPEEDEETPLLLLDSLPEVPRDLASLRETEQPSAGSFFIGVNGGVSGGGWSISSSPEEPDPDPDPDPDISNLEGEVSGVSNGVVSTPPSLFSMFS